ncbi:unnamed protein product, partial [Polarella glacialis]
MVSQHGKLVLADVFGMPLEHVLSFVPVESVVAAISSSKFLRIVACSDAVWGSRCDKLWCGKVYVPLHFREIRGMSRLAAYWGSLTDSRRCSIMAHSMAFVAIKANGRAVTWGYVAYGGISSAVATLLKKGVVRVCGTNGAFAAIKANGSVVTWGDADRGGNSSAV